MSAEEQEQVRRQLDRMLENHLFKNSRRYPALLRFIVEEALAGRVDSLRERPLGVHVFERPADYDTAVDPVVRVTAAEVRKRIAQYYHDEEHDAEIRIDLLPGRYTPEFRFKTPEKGAASEQDSVAAVLDRPGTGISLSAAAEHPSVVSTGDTTVRSTAWRRWPIIVCACLICTLAAVPLYLWLRPSAMDQLWAPLLGSRQPVLFCIPSDCGRKRGPADTRPMVDTSSIQIGDKDAQAGATTFLTFESLGENVVYSDMLALLKVSNVLAVRHRDYRAKLNVATNLEDLRQEPAVLIGGMDNQWTMLALAPLRFHFEGSDEDRYWVADRMNPQNKNWALDLKVQYMAVTRDYAIIARLHNKQTGQPEIIIAGIGMSGTAAAGEFVGDDKRIDELRKRIGPGFKDHDFEAVLSTDVVNGIAGSPTVIAVAVL